MAIYHRKMKCYSTYSVPLYKQQRHAIKAYFTHWFFVFRMAQRGPGVKFAGKVCYGMEGGEE